MSHNFMKAIFEAGLASKRPKVSPVSILSYYKRAYKGVKPSRNRYDPRTCSRPKEALKAAKRVASSTGAFSRE